MAVSAVRPLGGLLDRYVVGHLAAAFVLVIAILLALFGFLDFVDELDETGRGRYGAWDALYFVALTLPTRLLALVPVAALLASLLGLGSLHARNELTAMRAVGLSPRRIGLAVARAGILLLVAMVLLAEVIAPALAERAWTRRAHAIAGDVLAQGEDHTGFWFRDRERFIHVADMRYGHVPAGIEIFEIDASGRLQRFVQAEEAQSRGRGAWLLLGVRDKRIDGGQVTLERLPALQWSGFLSPEEGAVTELDVDSLAPSALAAYAADLRRRGQRADRYEAALWRKLSIPFATAAMLLISLPFAFGALGLHSTGQRVLAGAGIGIAFYLGEQILNQAGLLLGVPPALTAPLPALALAACGGWLLRRTWSSA